MADFPRVNISGWAKNQTLTSSQANQLDIDHSNSLNRTGGNIVGTVTVLGGASIVVGALANTTWQTGSTATWQSGSTLTVAAGTTFTIAAAASITGVATFGAGVAHLVTGASTLLKTTAGGRFQLGDDDWPTFSATRSINKAIDLASTVNYGTGWTTVVDGITGPATLAPLVIALPHLPHNGARLAQIDVYFTPKSNAAGRTAATTPATNIAAALMTRTMSAGSVLPARALYTSLTAYSPVSAADYGNGQIKKLSIFQSAVIDTSQTEYSIQLIDEAGVNSFAGNVFHQVVLWFDTIGTMAFP